MSYTVFIGDGESKAFNTVKDSNPYLATIEKEECVNHASKRLGTRLRKLKAETVETKSTKSGKQNIKRNLPEGQHKLTDGVIDILTKYYGMAIRSNKGKSVSEMRSTGNILASYFHCSSTDRTSASFVPRRHIIMVFLQSSTGKK